MLTTKQIALIFSLIAFMLSGTAYSQTEKWTFSSAEIVEKSRQDGKTSKKTIKSAREIPGQISFQYVPLEIVFFEPGKDSVFADVELRSGYIKVLVLQNDQTMTLLSTTGGEILSPEQLDGQNLTELIRLTDVKQSKGNVALKYNYLYVDINNNNRIIDGVMIINYRK